MRNIGIPRRPALRDPRRPISPWPIVFASALPFALAIIGVLALMVLARAAEPEPVRCQQLRDMATAWHGVPLNVAQQGAKRELIKWYVAHCRRKDVQL
jgi:hypothetical protein